MPESLTIGAFVFGAVLILLSLVGGEFKLYGAEVSGKAGRLGRVVAFALGVMLIVFGLFRGDRPAKALTNRDDQQGPAAPPTPASAREKPFEPSPVQANFAGIWTDDFGDVVRVTQAGDTFDFVSENYSTHISGRGHGTIHGNHFVNTFQTTRPSTGSGKGTLSADGTQTTGTYWDSMLGNYTLIFTRQQ